MKIKAVEIRDRMTFIPALAIDTEPANEGQRYLLSRCGFHGEGQIILVRLNNGQGHVDPYDWGDRTMQTAHIFVQERWSEIKDGQVIDVEYILGEKTAPCQSERDTTFEHRAAFSADSPKGPHDQGRQQGEG